MKIVDNTSKKENSESEENAQTIEIEFDSTYTVGDVCEFTLNSVEWNDEVLPSDTSGYYSYYEDQNGETFLIIRGEMKNIAGDSLDIQWTSEGSVIINDKYNYDATLVMESSENNDLYGNAKPLQTLNLIIYSSISDEAKESANTIKLQFSILADSSNISNFYDEDLPHETYLLNIK